MLTQNYQNISSNLINLLPPRQKEIISRRFGLEGGKRETLIDIGQDFGISRERVRQIEADAFEKLEREKQRKEVKEIFSYLNTYLKTYGNLKREDILLSDLGGDSFQNHVRFFLTLGDSFHVFRENQDFYTFWMIDLSLVQKAERILNYLLKMIRKSKKPLNEKDFFALNRNEDPKLFLSLFEVFKKIEYGPLNEIGLTEWLEIKPRGVKDKAYLALKKCGKPLHFKDIVDIARELESKFCPKKEILVQTLHNELIKDDRFILIGKGIYALKEWGYEAGTVKDFIIKFLTEAKQSLSKEEIIEKVLKHRQVKPTTILLNLQNKELFQKDDEGKYLIKNYEL